MNHYEELGLSSIAREDEIRKAHRTISKLLHPDLQTDPAVRNTAEIQMRRINAIVELLLDPERRRAYDESQEAPAVERSIPFPRRVPLIMPSAGWWTTSAFRFLLTIAGAVLLTLGTLWFFGGDLIQFTRKLPDVPQVAESQPAQTVREAPRPLARFPQGALARKLPGSKHELPPTQKTQSAFPPLQIPAKFDTQVDPLPQEREYTSGTSVNPPPPAADSGPLTVIPAAMPPPRPVETSLDGFWVYIADTGKSERAKLALYAPEYIQLRIHTDGGIEHGEYSSRYKVADQPISPDVVFRFEGRPGAASFPWYGPDDSRGMVDIKVLTSQSIQVNWRVTTFGSRISLGAGTAVMFRRAEP